MEYYTYKFDFLTSVHFGTGRLTDGENTIMADTVFSALCCEAVKADTKTLEDLITYAKEDRIIISDAMPFIKDKLYIPKPVCSVKTENEGDSVIKKNFKKLKYIPFDKIDEYINGTLNPVDENESIKKIGSFAIRTMAAGRNKEEADPFSVGTYRFSPKCGLYIIAGFSTKNEREFFERLLKGVSFSGIGGKRSSGFGRFNIIKQNLDEKIQKRLNSNGSIYMTLSVSMAQQNELTKSVENAQYMIVKRSGFIQSKDYSDEMRRKNDFYAFKGGSCFGNKFYGDIVDLSKGGKHAVYRYAKPMFLEVKQ